MKKKVLENTTVIIQKDGTPLRFSDGVIVRYADEEVYDDLIEGDTVVTCDQLPEDLKKEVIEQIWG